MGASSKKKAGKGHEVGKGRRKGVVVPPRPLTLSVRGFKSLRDRVEVELRPLTLLSGRNSSGKSSLMQPLLLLKQTLDAPLDYGPLKLDGPNVYFSEAQQLFWQGSRRADHATSFAIAIGRGTSCEFVFGRSEQGVTLVDVFLRSPNDGSVSLRGMEEQLKPLRLIRRKFNVRLAVTRSTSFSGVDERLPHDLDEQLVANQLVEHVIHVPGLRSNPERNYPVTAVGDTFPGPFPSYTASVLARWSSDDDDRLATVAEQLRELGLTWRVEARRLDDTRLELRVARTYEPLRGGSKDLVNVADVGFGVSQVLPVLVALLVAKTGDIVHIEQPEIHLHPAAQARLAQPLATAAKRGVIVVAETHSPLLLRSVQQLVADGSLPARDVALHWFRRDDAGATHVTTAELAPDGSYGNWPEDFEDAELDVEARLLAAMASQ